MLHTVPPLHFEVLWLNVLVERAKIENWALLPIFLGIVKRRDRNPGKSCGISSMARLHRSTSISCSMSDRSSGETDVGWGRGERSGGWRRKEVLKPIWII